MPPLPLTTLLNSTVIHNSTAAIRNATDHALQVVCAWPVSGQYGPGSRVLYYVLISACLFARKALWLRNACLAAALLFPAVAAIHGIVLAALHVEGAVDMDIYGAFQYCTIGILAAPLTVRRSRTYFFDHGRNLIFVWTLLLLAGLLSLTVEFFRVDSVDCTHDGDGNPISTNAALFPYGTTCGLRCSIEDGPFSSMRKGAANNIYVVPAPHRLTFNAATLMAAACCIPPILSLIFMWNKILEINWKKNRSNHDKEFMNEPISGTNGATPKNMERLNSILRTFLSAIEIPVFGAAVCAILIIGERNFFSHQVDYQTEPINSVGQWAPIVGTGLAILGSLYLLLAERLKSSEEESDNNSNSEKSSTTPGQHSPYSPTMRGALIGHRTYRTTTALTTTTTNTFTHSGYRKKVARNLTSAAAWFGTAADDRYDDSVFKRGPADDWPEIPGEERRNPGLVVIREQYNRPRDVDGNVTPRSRSVSRVGSVRSSYGGGMGGGGVGESPPQSPVTLGLPSIEFVPADQGEGDGRKKGASVDEVEDVEDGDGDGPASPAGLGINMRPRRDTLEVPPPVRYSTSRTSQTQW